MGRKRLDGNKAKLQLRTQLEHVQLSELKEGDADWWTPCQCCDEIPTVHPTRLCGPCAFGDPHLAGGNW